MMLKKLLNCQWVNFEYEGISLDAKIYVPPYVSATMEQPEEGGIKDLELKRLEFQGNDCLKLFENSNLFSEILDKIIEKYEV